MFANSPSNGALCNRRRNFIVRPCSTPWTDSRTRLRTHLSQTYRNTIGARRRRVYKILYPEEYRGITAESCPAKSHLLLRNENEESNRVVLYPLRRHGNDAVVVLASNFHDIQSDDFIPPAVPPTTRNTPRHPHVPGVLREKARILNYASQISVSD